jgi:hypothetical protein
MTTELDRRPDWMSAAIEKGMGAEEIGHIVRLQLELADREAKRLYTVALARFQMECPPIPKSKTFDVKGGVIAYAGWDEIGPIVAPVLARCGIVISWEEINVAIGTKENPSPPVMSGICTLTVGTHTRRHEFNGMPVPGNAISTTQAWGAGLSYFKRYSFINASGLIVTDEDNEAFLLDTLIASEVEKVLALCKEKKVDDEKFLAWAGVDAIDRILRKDFPKVIDMLKRKKVQA